MSLRGTPIIRQITSIGAVEKSYPADIGGGAPANLQDAAWTGLRIENGAEIMTVSFEVGGTATTATSFTIAVSGSFEAPADVNGLYIYFLATAAGSVKLFLVGTLLSAVMDAGPN